jgi:hypothetical protein
MVLAKKHVPIVKKRMFQLPLPAFPCLKHTHKIRFWKRYKEKDDLVWM